MPVSKVTPWLVDGFVLDGPPPTNRLKKALADKYDFSVQNGGTRTRVQENVAVVFHYVHFFRDLYVYDEQVLMAAAEDLGIIDTHQCRRIFERYLRAREEYTGDPNNVHIPAAAETSDKMLCGIVDNVIALMAVEREMSEQQLKGKIAARRKNWKMVVKEWLKLRIPNDPFFPNANDLLVQLMEKAEAARDVTDESTQDAVEDDEEAMMTDEEDMGKKKKDKGKGKKKEVKEKKGKDKEKQKQTKEKKGKGKEKQKGTGEHSQAANKDTQISTHDATTDDEQTIAKIIKEIVEAIANLDDADDDQMDTDSNEMTSHQHDAAIDPNPTPTGAELIPTIPPYDWRLAALDTLNIIATWREPVLQLAQHLDALAQDTRNPWRARFFFWMMARSLCGFIRWFDRFVVVAGQ